MRLEVKDYLLSLKEKDELDLLIGDLYLQKGYHRTSNPKTGNRQYGVDLQLNRGKEILLCVIKQGNIDRKVWDDGPQSVRQSLDEIFDVYLRNFAPEDFDKEVSVKVISNGYMEENVRLNWNGYCERKYRESGEKIQIEYISVDKLTLEICAELFQGNLFPDNVRAFLRRAMFFSVESDYNKAYYERMIDYVLDDIERKNDPKYKPKLFKRQITSIILACNMIAIYARNEMHFKVGIMVFEYLILRYWRLMLKKGWFEKTHDVEWLVRVCSLYEENCHHYYIAVKDLTTVPGGLNQYYVLEERLKLYEIAGFMASYAYYRCSMYGPGDAEGLDVVNTLIMMINVNPTFLYTCYDSQIAEISMIWRVLLLLGRVNDVTCMLSNYLQILGLYDANYKKHPVEKDDFEAAVRMNMGEEQFGAASNWESSGLWGYALLWMCEMDMQELYDVLYEGYLSSHLNKVTKCVWFLRESEEEAFYDYNAMQLAGEGTAIEPVKEYEVFRKRITSLLDQYKGEKFSFEKYGFEALEMIGCRYFHYVPRVMKDESRMH